MSSSIRKSFRGDVSASERPGLGEMYAVSVGAFPRSPFRAGVAKGVRA